MNNCELCAFKNPKATATGIIIQDNKLLLLKRLEEPFAGMWDLPGGYMQEKEEPDATLRRELKEELRVEVSNLEFIRSFPGAALWKEQEFLILSLFYLVDLQGQEIDLNNKENSAYSWVSISELKSEDIAFDSNQEFVKWLKERFTFDLDRVGELVHQLDDSAEVKEQSLYKAILNGYVSCEYDGDKLIGMGWIFPRQTMLRKQAVVEDMILDEAYRGRGLGRKLLDNLVQWAKKEGVEVIELTSNPKREAANALYKKYGFQLHPTNHYLYQIQ